MPPLSWRHHTLIQALLSRGPLKEDEFRSIFSQVTKKSSGTQQQLFNEYLRKMNAELGYAQLELRACRNQYDGSVYYGVVNNVSDDQSKLGTKYTVPQIAFYKGIVESIIQDAEASGCISNTDALNIRLEAQIHEATDTERQGGPSQIPPAFKNFSMSQKEKTLDQLVNDKWLSSTQDGIIGIGVRSFLDLRSWFRSNEVPTCEVCNEAAVKAQRCPNDTCNARLHQYCLEKKFSQRRVDKVCPTCGTKWPGSIVKGEAAEELSDDPDVPSRNPQPSTMKTRRKKYREDNAGVTESESPVRKRVSKREDHAGRAGPESSQTPVVLSDKKRVTRRSARVHGN